MRIKLLSTVALSALLVGGAAIAAAPAQGAPVAPVGAAASGGHALSSAPGLDQVQTSHARTDVDSKLGESVPSIVGGFLTDHETGEKYRVLSGSYFDDGATALDAKVATSGGKVIAFKAWEVDDPEYIFRIQIGDGPVRSVGATDQRWVPGGDGTITFLNVNDADEDIPVVTVKYIPKSESAQMFDGVLLEGQSDRGFAISQGKFDGDKRSAIIQAFNSKQQSVWANVKENADYTYTIKLTVAGEQQVLHSDGLATGAGFLKYYAEDSEGNVSVVLAAQYTP